MQEDYFFSLVVKFCYTYVGTRYYSLGISCESFMNARISCVGGGGKAVCVKQNSRSIVCVCVTLLLSTRTHTHTERDTEATHRTSGEWGGVGWGGEGQRKLTHKRADGRRTTLRFPNRLLHICFRVGTDALTKPGRKEKVQLEKKKQQHILKQKIKKIC